MQYQFFKCNENNIFWNNQTENKPSNLFIASLPFEEITTQLNYLNQFNAEINYPADDYFIFQPKYFKVVNGNNNRYYFVSNITNENTNTITLYLELDVWATYILPMFGNNTDKYIDLTRSHVKYPLAFQLNDELLNQIPITYKSSDVVRTYYPYEEADNKYIYKINPSGDYKDELIKIDNDDIINANIYYVFRGLNLADTENDYYFIPVLSKNKQQIYSRGIPISSDVIYTQTVSSNTSLTNLVNAYNDAVATHGEQNIFIIYSNTKIPDYAKPIQLKIDLKETKQCIPNSTETMQAKITVNGTLYLDNNIIDKASSYSVNIVSGIYCKPTDYPPAPNPIVFTAKIYLKEGVIYNDTLTNNYIYKVNQLINNTNLANLFVGKYVACNFLNLYKNLEIINNSDIQNMIAFKIDVNGTFINDLNLFNFDIDERLPDIYNSTDINNRVILNYYKLTYLNADFNNWNYFLQSNGNIVINGLFLFNGNPTIIADNSYLQTLNSIMMLPYQIPSAQDEYVKYYAGVMSQINTGLEQARVNMSMGVVNNIAGGLFSGMGMFAGKNNSVMGQAGNLFNTFSNVAGNVIDYSFYLKNTNSKLSDIKRISGVQYAPSNIKDASTLLYSIVEDKYCETMEVQVPSDDSLKMLNNVLYLYGNLSPVSIKINDILPRQYFNYIQISQDWLARNLNTFLAKENDAIINRAIQILAGGVRVWNILPNYDVQN